MTMTPEESKEKFENEVNNRTLLNEEQEKDFVRQIRPTALTMIASILSDMVYVEDGKLIRINQNKLSSDLQWDTSVKLKEARTDLKTAEKKMRQSELDLKKAQWESIGKIKEKDIKKVEEKILSAEKSIEQLNEIKTKTEEDVEYYSEIIKQNSDSELSISGFWQMKNCVSADYMRVLGIKTDSYSDQTDAFTCDEAEMFIRRFSMLTMEDFRIPKEYELFLSVGGRGTEIRLMMPTPTGTATCKASKMNKTFKRALGCEWTVRREHTDFVPITYNLVFYTTGEKMICTNTKPEGIINAIVNEKKLSRDYDEWLKDHNGFRLACSSNAYERLKKSISNQLRDIVDEYVSNQKVTEYKKFFQKKTIRFLDKPVTSQLYITLLLLDAMNQIPSDSIYSQWHLLTEETISDEKMTEVINKLNILYDGKYTFSNLSSNKSVFTSLKNNGLISEGQYLSLL